VGQARLTLSLAGHIEQSRLVQISEDEPARLAVTLQRAARTVAILTVMSEPAGASVLLDGEEVGVTPLTLGEVEPGARRVAVEAEGRAPWSSELVLEAGGATRAEVALASEGNRLWPVMRWVAWGGSAAILAAGVVLGSLALWHRDQFFEGDDPTRSQLDGIRAESLAADILIGTGAAALATSLVLELVLGRAPRSTATVSMDR
jgi:hypothetical protein